MKSTEVYAVLGQELTPVLAPAGFKRGRAFLSWYRAGNGGYLYMAKLDRKWSRTAQRLGGNGRRPEGESGPRA
jgi:hypothetical protein